MPTTDKPNNDDGLTLLDQKRALEDEIWFLAIAENFARGRLKGVLSREEVIAKYTQYPDMKAYVDDHVARKTCLFGIRELRKRRETNQQALQAQRSSAPPKPARNPEMEWMAPFRAKPVTIVSTVGRPLPPPPWGIPPDDLNRALEALPNESSEQAANANTTTNSPIYGTGLPGRRSTWFLVEAEVRRRFAPDHASKTTAEWAREMLAWLRDEHPNAPPATEQAIRLASAAKSTDKIGSGEPPKFISRLEYRAAISGMKPTLSFLCQPPNIFGRAEKVIMQPSNRVGRCHLRYPGPLTGIVPAFDSLVLDARHGAAEWWQPDRDHTPATRTLGSATEDFISFSVVTPAFGGGASDQETC